MTSHPSIGQITLAYRAGHAKGVHNVFSGEARVPEEEPHFSQATLVRGEKVECVDSYKIIIKLLNTWAPLLIKDCVLT